MNEVAQASAEGGMVLPDRTDCHPEREDWHIPGSPSKERGILPARADFGGIQVLFESQAARRPEAVAVSFAGRALSYGELNKRANHLATKLRELGVGPETLVGVFTERSLEMLVGIFGILKAGGAYLPLDPSYPTERLAFMLQDAQPKVLLTHAKLLSKLPAHQAEIICLETLRTESEAGNLELLNQPGNVAYVIYTSGSTGKPKGVQVTHQNVLRLFRETQPWFHFNERDVWTMFHSFAFDFSVWEIFGALLHGGKLVVVPFTASRSPGEFRELLARESVTVLNQTPSAFRQLMQADEASQGVNLLALRLVIFGGEALEMNSLKPWFERHGDQVPQLVNMYGITETTVHVTYRPLTKADVNQPCVIGVPIPDLQIHIVDEQLRLVADGTAGEMLVGGAGLARGYLGRSELTAQKFIADPFSGKAEARVYRSGDLARRLPNGDIEYLGRADSQVKIRGHRIELGEIEAALNRHPAIRESAVVLREEGGERHLTGYVVPSGKELPTTSELRSHLLASLPEYMVPAGFVWMEKMPLTLNGKLDRQALPARTAQRPELNQTYTAPRTELEKFLAGIWREILRLEQVGIHDKFFELGGDSLQGARFIAQVETKLREQIYVVVLFEAPTIAEFAAYLEKNYCGAVGRIFGPVHTGSPAEPRGERVDAVALAKARGLITPLAPRVSRADETRKNAPALFVLAPPRSGTSLLRVMLAGHPEIFATSELHLLEFATLAERKAAFAGKYGLWLEGLIRAVMEIKKCKAEEAEQIMEELEVRNIPVKQVYQLLQEWLGGKLLVEKTPAYGLDLETLKRAEEDFENPLYIHLVRHPQAMVRSFERNHLDQVYFRYEHSFSGRELGELYWLMVNQNALEFLKAVPAHRKVLIRFEDLVTRPADVMQQLSHTFGIGFHPGMLEPYKNTDKKMLDGVHAQSRSMTDAKFFNYKGIEAKVAHESVDGEDDFLGDLTWELAKAFNYQKPARLKSTDDVTGTPKTRSGDRTNLMEERRRHRQAQRRRLECKEIE